jgi:hypothetical protein
MALSSIRVRALSRHESSPPERHMWRDSKRCHNRGLSVTDRALGNVESLCARVSTHSIPLASACPAILPLRSGMLVSCDGMCRGWFPGSTVFLIRGCVRRCVAVSCWVGTLCSGFEDIDEIDEKFPDRIFLHSAHIFRTPPLLNRPTTLFPSHGVLTPRPGHGVFGSPVEPEDAIANVSMRVRVESCQ